MDDGDRLFVYFSIENQMFVVVRSCITFLCIENHLHSFLFWHCAHIDSHQWYQRIYPYTLFLLEENKYLTSSDKMANLKWLFYSLLCGFSSVQRANITKFSTKRAITAVRWQLYIIRKLKTVVNKLEIFEISFFSQWKSSWIVDKKWSECQPRRNAIWACNMPHASYK